MGGIPRILIMHNDKTICDIVGEYLNSDDKARIEFLTAKTEEQNIAVRDAIAKALSNYGNGEGNVPIATTKRGYIIAGYENPNARDEEPINTLKKAEGSMWHRAMYSKSFVADISRVIKYNILKKYVNGIDDTIPSELEGYIKGTFKSTLSNVNRSYRRERYNLILSINEYKELPEELDFDSVAGMNLVEITEMLLRMAVSEEDSKGNKKYIKRSQLNENPLIREAVRVLIYKLAKAEVEAMRAEAKAEAEEAIKAVEEAAKGKTKGKK